MNLTVQDTLGQIWTINKIEKRVDIHNRFGTYIKSLPSSGEDYSDFTNPTSIAVMNNYVAVCNIDEYGDGCVYFFDLQGKYHDQTALTEFPSVYTVGIIKSVHNGYNNQVFINGSNKQVTAVTIGSDGIIDAVKSYKSTYDIKDVIVGVPYVPPAVEPKPVIIDQGGNRVLLVKDISTFADLGDELVSPTDAVITSTNIFVVDFGHNQIKKFDLLGTVLETIGDGTIGDGNNQFNDPCNIIQTSDGNLWISDFSNNRIQIFDPDTLAYVATVDCDFYNPSFMTQIGSNVWISDSGNKRIVLVDVASRTLGPVIKEPFKKVSSIRQMGTTNNVLVTNSIKNGEVVVFDTEGNYKKSFGKQQKMNTPVDACYNPKTNSVWVSVLKDNKIIDFTYNDADDEFYYNGNIGTKGTSLGYFKSPCNIEYYKDMMYVVDQGNSRVQEFDATTKQPLNILDDDVNGMILPSKFVIAPDVE